MFKGVFIYSKLNKKKKKTKNVKKKMFYLGNTKKKEINNFKEMYIIFAIYHTQNIRISSSIISSDVKSKIFSVYTYI